MLGAYARRLVRQTDEAAEVLQEVALIVLRHPRGPRDVESFGPWCRGIVRKVAVRRRLAREHRAALFTSLGSAELAMPQADAERRVMAREILDHALSDLDGRARDLLLRRYLLQDTATDLAAELRGSAAAVRMRLKRVREALRGPSD